MIPLITKFNSNAVLYDSLGETNKSYISMYSDKDSIYFLRDTSGTTIKYDTITEIVSSVRINIPSHGITGYPVNSIMKYREEIYGFTGFAVKQFINECCKYLDIKIYWSGKGYGEYAYTFKNKKKIILIKIDKEYFRPLEVDYLKGDASKAYKKLKFRPKHDLKSLIKDMISGDLELARKESKVLL
jgi:hypothetical protein